MKPLQGIWTPPDLSMQSAQGLGTGKDQLKAAAKQVEVLFLNELLKTMMEHTSFGKDKTVGTYLPMVTTEIASSLADRGIGVKEFIMKNSSFERMVSESGKSGQPKSIEQAPMPSPEVPATNEGLSMPVRGRISSSYGTRRDPLGSGTVREHKGIDIAVPTGTPVKAAAPGTVTYAGYSKSYDNYVVVEHEGGMATIYGHNSANMVKAGDKVDGGTAIAMSGSTGQSTGSHLHFEVRREGVPVDPVDVVG